MKRLETRPSYLGVPRAPPGGRELEYRLSRSFTRRHRRTYGSAGLPACLGCKPVRNSAHHTMLIIHYAINSASLRGGEGKQGVARVRISAFTIVHAPGPHRRWFGRSARMPEVRTGRNSVEIGHGNHEISVSTDFVNESSVRRCYVRPWI